MAHLKLSSFIFIAGLSLAAIGAAQEADSTTSHLGHMAKALKGPEATVSCLADSGPSGLIAAGYYNNSVVVWNVESSQPLELKGHDNWVTAVAWNPNGPLLASAGLDKRIIFWRLPTKTPTHVIEGAAEAEPGTPAIMDRHTDWIRALVFTPDGKSLVSVGDDKAILVWDVPSGGFKRRLDCGTDWVMALAVSPSGEQLVSGGYGKSLKFWNLTTGELAREIATGQTILALAWSPDGQTIASGGQDKLIHLWTVDSGQQRATLSGHTDQVFALAFHPNGQVLASCSGDKTVRLWNVAKGEELESLTGHEQWIYSLCFNQDGSRLASGGADQTVILWDMSGKTGQVGQASLPP